MTPAGTVIDPAVWARAGIISVAIAVAVQAVDATTRLVEAIVQSSLGVLWERERGTLVALLLYLAVASLLWLRSGRIADALLPDARESTDATESGLPDVLTIAFVLIGAVIVLTHVQQIVTGIIDSLRPAITNDLGVHDYWRKSGLVRAIGGLVPAAAGLAMAGRSRALANAISDPAGRRREEPPEL